MTHTNRHVGPSYFPVKNPCTDVLTPPGRIHGRIAEVQAIEQGAPALPPTRSRRPGGGRKKATAEDPALLTDLQTLVESTTPGDRDSPRLWTARSQRTSSTRSRRKGTRPV